MELFKRYKNKRPANLQPILTADELLSDTNITQFLKKIELLVGIPVFLEFYDPIIKKFSEFVQSVTENQCNFFKPEVSFLERGLERAARSLYLCLICFFPREHNLSYVSRKNKLELYAVFTAALLLDVGKFALKYKVILYDENAQFIEEKDPYSNPKLFQASYYKFDYIKENLDDLCRSITPILARQLLDNAAPSGIKSGFNWIASDCALLRFWIYLLSGEEERVPMTSFMAMVPWADVDVVNKYRKNRQVAATSPSGDAFIQWIRKELAEERIGINGVGDKIFVLDRKVFLSSELFQEFVSKNPIFKRPDIVEKQFIDVAALYQVSISELDKRYRAFGGISGLADLNKRYQAIGGLSAEDKKEVLQSRFLVGDLRLIFLITSQVTIAKLINLDMPINSINLSPLLGPFY